MENGYIGEQMAKKGMREITKKVKLMVNGPGIMAMGIPGKMGIILMV